MKAKPMANSKSQDPKATGTQEPDLRAENDALKTTVATLTERLEKLEASQTDQAEAIDKLAKVRETQKANQQQATQSGGNLKNPNADPVKALERLDKIWSRDKERLKLKPPQQIATRTYSVEISRSNGQTHELKVANCYDESDAKCAALQRLGLRARECKLTVKSA